MVCFSIVLGTAIAVQCARGKLQERLPHTGILALLLWGGAVALVVDHFMNGELFLIGGNVLWDILVGIGMTAVIFVIWGAYAIVKRALRKEYRIEA